MHGRPEMMEMTRVRGMSNEKRTWKKKRKGGRKEREMDEKSLCTQNGLKDNKKSLFNTSKRKKETNQKSLSVVLHGVMYTSTYCTYCAIPDFGKLLVTNNAGHIYEDFLVLVVPGYKNRPFTFWLSGLTNLVVHKMVASYRLSNDQSVCHCMMYY